ncbi:ABC transporter ATP-binding protein [Tepidibacter mesophilus]|uniref:ABC transporter ATP-binding protein n=1 Tax=Tepidibacter mesophilus TaxID=655607 RepID=UPI000C071B08|nr:ABC transporter ATP-binding protein [Tepidibacter mesophilus]
MNIYQNKIELNNIKKYFDDKIILNDINIHLKEGEFVSLLGPSGSGKSTIFNIISELIKPDEGNVLIDSDSRVSYMPQKDLLLPWKKIIDNVAIPLTIRGYSKKDARNEVKDYFKAFSLDGYEYKYPSQLSGGMRQRAAFMRTYINSKDIMLLDEPFGGLDAITKSNMHEWLLNVLEKFNTSVLFITHDVEEAILLSDRIYILSDKPASVKEEIIVNLDKNRSKDIVTSKRFNEIKKYILDIM